MGAKTMMSVYVQWLSTIWGCVDAQMWYMIV